MEKRCGLSLLSLPELVSIRVCVVFLAVLVLNPRSMSAQGSFDPWIPFTAVSAHQVHLPSDQTLFWAYNGFSAWIWGPATGFTEMPNLATNTFCSGHAGLSNGDYMVAGGLFVDSAQQYNLAPAGWTTQPNMAATRFYPTATTLGDGRILVTGGTGAGSLIPEIWDPGLGTWTSLPGAALPLGVYPFMFLLPNGTVFFAGPATITGTLDINTQVWTIVSASLTDGASAVSYQPGIIMKCGGFGTANTITETIDLNVAVPTWTAVGSMAFERHDHSLTILPDGTVFAIGGHDSVNNPVLPGELWDPTSGNWATMASLFFPRQYHSTSMLLRDGRVVVGGGDGFSSIEIYNPPYLSASSRPQISSAPAQVTYGQNFSMPWTSFQNISRVTLLRLGAETHSFDQNQRFMDLSFSVTGPFGKRLDDCLMTASVSVTAPANGNIAPPGYYMIFLVDSQGTPSVGEYILLN